MDVCLLGCVCEWLCISGGIFVWMCLVPRRTKRQAELLISLDTLSLSLPLCADDVW